MAKITFLAEQDCLFSGIIGLMDAFSIANLLHHTKAGEAAGPLFETEIVTMDGKPKTAYGGIPIHPSCPAGEVKETDLIIIPPFIPRVELPPETKEAVIPWTRTHYRQKTLIGALCTGVFTLAASGLLDGKIATTNWLYAGKFRRNYPQVHLQPERILTEDSGLLCAGAATASYNLALHIIETFGTPEVASVCAKALLVDPNRSSQAPYAISNFRHDHGDMEILKAQIGMETRFSESLTIDTLAGEVGISPRHFKRRFKGATGESPLSYLQRVRIEAAKNRLETTKDTMDDITLQIGYEDSSSFRRLFKKSTGLSPREYREKFTRA